MGRKKLDENGFDDSRSLRCNILDDNGLFGYTQKLRMTVSLKSSRLPSQYLGPRDYLYLDIPGICLRDILNYQTVGSLDRGQRCGRCFWRESSYCTTVHVLNKTGPDQRSLILADCFSRHGRRPQTQPVLGKPSNLF